MLQVDVQILLSFFRKRYFILKNNTQDTVEVHLNPLTKEQLDSYISTNCICFKTKYKEIQTKQVEPSQCVSLHKNASLKVKTTAPFRCMTIHHNGITPIENMLVCTGFKFIIYKP
jgi:hypothetical protein